MYILILLVESTEEGHICRPQNLSHFYFTLILSPILSIDFKSRLHVFFWLTHPLFLSFYYFVYYFIFLLLLLYFNFSFMLFIITIIIIILLFLLLFFFYFLHFSLLSPLTPLPTLTYPRPSHTPLFPLFLFLFFFFSFLFLFGLPPFMGSFFLNFFKISPVPKAKRAGPPFLSSLAFLVFLPPTLRWPELPPFSH